MKAYRIVFLLLTLTLALFLYGAFSAPRMTPEPSQKEVITVWGWDDFLPDAFAEYQKSHPDIALNYTVVEKSEYLQRFKLALALNQPLPDICILESETLDGINGAELFLDLEASPYFLPRQEVLEFRLAQFENELGHLWAVPATLSASGVAYNRTVAQAFLATEDPVQVGIVFSSWADVISKGMKFKEQFPDRAMFASLEDAAVMLFGQSRTPYIQNNTLLQPYRFLNAFQILDALQEAGLVFSLQQYSPQWMNSLETDQVFFYPCSLWLMSMGIFHTGQAWGFTRAPSGSYAWGGTVWAIPKTSTHAATAWEFMQTVLLSPSGAAYAKNHGTGTLISYSPAYNEEGYSDLIMEDFGGQNIGKMYLDQIFPEVQTRPAGENEALLKEVYLQTVRAMIGMPEMNGEQAYALFLERLHQRLPDLQEEPA